MSKPDTRLRRIGESVEAYRDRKESNAKLAAERRVVRALVHRLGAKVLASISRDDEDEMYMTFSWFYDRWPDFPVRLSAHEVWRPGLSSFLRFNTRKNEVWTKWRDLLDAFLPDKPESYGFAFPFPDATLLGYGVMHNGRLPEPVDDFACMVRKFGEDFVYMETLDSFAERILLIWEPR